MKKILCALLALFSALSSVGVASFAIEMPDNEFHTEEQYEYILRSKDDLNAVYDYANGDYERSIPDSYVCSFWDDDIPNSDSYVFQKSASPDFAECETFRVRVRFCELYNLLLGEHFYWRAGVDLDTIGDSAVHEETVSSLCPRNCYVPGVTNVRDIGGYESSLVPGGRIRQGLYYRGAFINDITREGVSVLYNQLGVRSEIDLRDADHGRSYVRGIERIAYYSAPMHADAEIFTKYAEQFRLVFGVISRAAESPVYLHCQAGADRTGFTSMMLLLLCGASYHDAAFDYLFTNFSVMGPRHLDEQFNGWYEKLSEFGGDTKAEQVKNWLLSIGVTEETVEIIRETFVEGYESAYLKTLIREIRLEGETLRYTVGDAPSFTGVVPDGAVYTLGEGAHGAEGLLEWRGDDGTSFTSSETKNDALYAEGKLIEAFVRGVTYTLDVTFAVADGAVNGGGEALTFSPTAKLVINGEERPGAHLTLSDDGLAATFADAVVIKAANITGDANGDDDVNARDVIALMRSIVGLDDECFDPDAVDFDANGRLNSRDVIALMKYVAALCA